MEMISENQNNDNSYFLLNTWYIHQELCLGFYMNYFI